MLRFKESEIVFVELRGAKAVQRHLSEVAGPRSAAERLAKSPYQAGDYALGCFVARKCVSIGWLMTGQRFDFYADPGCLDRRTSAYRRLKAKLVQRWYALEAKKVG